MHKICNKVLGTRTFYEWDGERGVEGVGWVGVELQSDAPSDKWLKSRREEICRLKICSRVAYIAVQVEQTRNKAKPQAVQ